MQITKCSVLVDKSSTSKVKRNRGKYTVHFILYFFLFFFRAGIRQASYCTMIFGTVFNNIKRLLVGVSFNNKHQGSETFFKIGFLFSCNSCNDAWHFESSACKLSIFYLNFNSAGLCLVLTDFIFDAANGEIILNGAQSWSCCFWILH